MCKSRFFLCCILAFSTFGLPAFAKGPGGQTPATEDVCDPLKADDVTKGLYGLCVAFCEAPGHAGELASIKSQGGRAAVESSSPLGRILAKYDKIKQASDREMPCLADANSAPDPVPVPEPVAPSCPCWTAAEANAIDGVLSDGSTIAAGWPAPTSSSSACSADAEMPYIQEANNDATEVSYIQVVDVASTIAPLHQCKYRKILPGQVVADVLLSIEWHILTAEEHAACKADLLKRQAAMGLCQPTP